MHTIQQTVDGRLVADYACSTVVIVPFSHDFVVPGTSLWRGACMCTHLISTCLAIITTKTHSLLGLGSLQNKTSAPSPSHHHWCWVRVKVWFLLSSLKFWITWWWFCFLRHRSLMNLLTGPMLELSTLDTNGRRCLGCEKVTEGYVQRSASALFFRPNAIGSGGKGDFFLKVYRAWNVWMYVCVYIFVEMNIMFCCYIQRYVFYLVIMYPCTLGGGFWKDLCDTPQKSRERWVPIWNNIVFLEWAGPKKPPTQILMTCLVFVEYFWNRKQRCVDPCFACFCFLLIFLLSRVKMISSLNFLSFEFWNLKLHHLERWCLTIYLIW